MGTSKISRQNAGISCQKSSVSLVSQQVLNPTPLNPTPATCHKRKRKLRCSFRSAALQKLHCNICFSAVRKSFGPKAALQQTENCTATSKKLRCRKVALSCRFPAGFKPPRLGPAEFRGTYRTFRPPPVHMEDPHPTGGCPDLNPKDPAVLKILRRSKFTMHSKFTTAQ